jgi:hypothetical protein
MGFYGEQVLPRLTDRMLGNREFAKLREEVCAGLHGDVVEIGFGSGLNMPFLPLEVTGVWAVEPSAVARRRLRDRDRAQLLPEGPEGVGIHVRRPRPEPVTGPSPCRGVAVYLRVPEG